MPEQLTVDVGDGVVLQAERWAGDGPTVVLLHAGICDRRSWHETAELLSPLTVVAYDQRGFGDSPDATGDFRHVDDLDRLLAVLCPDEPAALVGSSMGGRNALDFSVLHPDRVSALALVAPAVSGAPQVTSLDPDTQRLSDAADKATDDGDLDEINRLTMWVWLDGPAAAEGRVGGSARALAIDMNAALLRRGQTESTGVSGVDAWSRLEQVTVPTTVVCGDLDVPFIVERSREMAARIPDATYIELPGMAHLPYLENPGVVAELIKQAVARGTVAS